MPVLNKKKIRRLNITLHRDLGYFVSSLVLAYCLSGIALNHVDSWNPDFIIEKIPVQYPHKLARHEVDKAKIEELGKLVGEEKYKVYDFPTPDQVKIYYNNASLHMHLDKGTGIYEKVARRPLFYQTNVLHRNSLKGWNWAADLFALVLILINITGLFILKGRHGIGGRGKWLIAAGFIPPLVALIIQGVR
jgi:uncharacterized protein